MSAPKYAPEESSPPDPSSPESGIQVSTNDDIARSLFTIGSWLSRYVKAATWAMAGGALLGAAAAELATRYHFTLMTTVLGTFGMVSIGACVGRILDRRFATSHSRAALPEKKRSRIGGQLL